GKEIGDVGGGVRADRGGDRTHRPVGELFGLVEVRAEQGRYQGAERRQTETHETGGQLQIEETGGTGPGGSLEDREIARSGEGDHGPRRAQNIGQGAHVARERVDERNAAGPRDLYQTQARPVGAFGEELGVEAVGGLVEEQPYELGQVAVAIDPAHFTARRTGDRLSVTRHATPSMMTRKKKGSSAACAASSISVVELRGRWVVE